MTYATKSTILTGVVIIAIIGSFILSIVGLYKSSNRPKDKVVTLYSAQGQVLGEWKTRQVHNTSSSMYFHDEDDKLVEITGTVIVK